MDAGRPEPDTADRQTDLALPGPGPAARSIIKDIANPLLQLFNVDYHDAAFVPPRVGEVDVSDPASLTRAITELEKQMKAAAKRLEFEEAAQLRDRIKELRAAQIYKS